MKRTTFQTFLNRGNYFIFQRVALIFLFVIFTFPLLVSQAEESQIDSIGIEVQENSLIKIIDQQRTDSLKRIELEEKLLSEQLKSSKEKSRLIEELNFLKSRDSLLYQKRKQKVDSLRIMNKGVAVAPFGDTIFIIYNKLGSYTQKERANAIEERIHALTDNYLFDPDSLVLEESETGWSIAWGDQSVVSVNEQDALWADIPIYTLAKNYLEDIRHSIKQYREATSLSNFLKGLGKAVLIVVALITLIVLLFKSFRWIKSKIVSFVRKKLVNKLNKQGTKFLTSDKLIRVFWFFLNVFKWALILIAIYLALPMILNQFHETKGYAPVLLSYFIDPLKNIARSIVNYMPKLGTIIVIIIIFRYILKLLKYLATELEKGNIQIRGFYKEWALPTYQLLRTLLFAFLIIVIFPYLPGSESPIFAGVSVFAGLLITLSSAGSLSNVIAGLMLTYMRTFNVGDRIKIGDISGDIIEKSLLVTRIRTIKNEIISIPNSQIINNHTINYTADLVENPLIVYISITVAYDVPWQKVHELALKVCAEISLLEKKPAPFVLQQSLNDTNVTYQINAYTRNPQKQAVIFSEMHKGVLDVFNEAGIELVSPTYTAVRDGSQKNIPTDKKEDEKFVQAIQVEIKKDEEQKTK